MEDQIGKNLALGIGEGFENNIGAVNAEISRALKMDDYNINVNRTGNNGSIAGGTVVVNQYNNYNNLLLHHLLYLINLLVVMKYINQNNRHWRLFSWRWRRYKHGFCI